MKPARMSKYQFDRIPVGYGRLYKSDDNLKIVANRIRNAAKYYGIYGMHFSVYIRKNGVYVYRIY